jgi:hypothetical protein
MSDRKYVIIDTSDLDNVDFNEVLETSKETCLLSLDGTKSFVKYKGEMPSSVSALNSKSEEYTHTQILEILASSEWVEETTTS